LIFVPKIRLHVKLPIFFNNKIRVPNKYFIELEEKFIESYGGYTRLFPPAKGKWKDKSGTVYVDMTISYDVFIERESFTKNVKLRLNGLIEELKTKFEQKEISCYYHDIMST